MNLARFQSRRIEPRFHLIQFVPAKIVWLGLPEGLGHIVGRHDDDNILILEHADLISSIRASIKDFFSI